VLSVESRWNQLKLRLLNTRGTGAHFTDYVFTSIRLRHIVMLTANTKVTARPIKPSCKESAIWIAPDSSELKNPGSGRALGRTT